MNVSLRKVTDDNTVKLNLMHVYMISLPLLIFGTVYTKEALV